MRSIQRLGMAAVSRALALLFAGSALAGGIPLGSAFTYQGQLKQSGAPAGGEFDFEFRLFRVPAGGAVQGTVVANDLAVTDGLFTINLDFGGSHYSGDALYLEIAVNGTTLTPRQPLTPTPFALHAASATISGEQAEDVDFTNAGNSFTGSGAGLTSLNASNLSSGTLPSSRLSGLYGSILTFSHPSSSFAGNGASLTNLNASNLASGNLAAARLPTGGNWALTSNLNIGSNNLLIDPINRLVGIGTTSPLFDLDVVRTPLGDNGNPVAIFRQTGATNSVGAIRLQNTANNHFNLGITTGNEFALAYNSSISLPSALLRITSTGNVGIGALSPTHKLHVVGTTLLDGATNFTSVPTLPTTTRTLRVNPAAFAPTSSAIAWDRDQVEVFGTTAGQAVEFMAPLDLPDGAIVTAITFLVRDNDAVQSMLCVLNRDDVVVGGPGPALATVGSAFSAPGASASVAGVSIPGLPHTIDHVNHSYALYAQWNVPATPTNMRLFRVEVTYTITKPLP